MIGNLPPKRRVPVTVCVAAICKDELSNQTMIFGAADRMLTAGDIEFEPPRQKMLALTSSIVVMSAGDDPIQMEILRDVQAAVSKRVAEEPSNWWRVKDVAFLYVHYRNKAKQRRAESAILEPLNLSLPGFLHDKNIPQETKDQLTKELINFELPRVEAIFAGVDNDVGGTHIYVVRDGEVSCHDGIAFASIGVGAWHSDSQFMLGRHAWCQPVADTLLLVYMAKKRAEVAPGVGKATDMFLAGPSLGSLTMIGDMAMNKLKDIYQGIIRIREDETLETARQEVRKYVQGLREAATAKDQAAKTVEGGKAPADGGPIPDFPKEAPSSGEGS